MSGSYDVTVGHEVPEGADLHNKKQRSVMVLNSSFIKTLSFSLFLCAGAQVQAQSDFGVYLDVESFTYSEPVSIDMAIEDWLGPDFERGDNQWTSNWAEAGFRWKNWSVGYLLREDYDLQFSEDLSELYWKTENKRPLDVGREYDVLLKVNSFSGEGFRFAFRDRKNHTFYQVGISYFEAQQLMDGELSGTAIATSTSDYDFNGEVLYHYHEDVLFDRPVTAPQGTGYALDATLKWDYEDHALFVNIKDLYGRIYWKDAPYTVGIANSNNTSIDSKGFKVVKPALSGVEGYDKEYVQKLSPRWHAEYDYSLNKYLSVGAAGHYQYDQFLYGVSVALGQKTGIRFTYWPEAELYQVHTSIAGFRVGLGANTTEVEAIDNVWLTISWDIGRF